MWVDEMRDALRPLRVALVLDRSGSMEAMRQQAINLFNEQLQIVKMRPGAQACLVTFSDTATLTRPLQAVELIPALDASSYAPRGLTAMYDGLDLAIEHLQPGTWATNLIVVVTDGLENHSRNVSGGTLSSRIKDLQAAGNWTFTVLGANIDLAALSATLSIPRGNLMSFQPCSAGLQGGTGTLMNSMRSFVSSAAPSTENFFGE
jgi:hypothetical protein